MAAVPVRIDGEGVVEVGERVKLGYGPAPLIGSGEILLQARGKDARITVGSRTAFSNNVSVVAMSAVEIGEDCLIGDMVTIFDSDFHEIDPRTRCRSSGATAPVKIGSNVWIGSRVIILKGADIGANSIVAAGSVVSKSVPANVIAAGVPARVIRRIDEALVADLGVRP